MIDTILTGSVVETEPGVSGVSWASVLAGAVTSLAITFVLISFGTGMGFSMASPWPGVGASATTFKITTGIYLVVIAMLSSSLGGYIAGRLRTKWIGVHTDEVYFRDTAHGFLAWAVSSIVGAIFLASAASTMIGGAASGATQVAGNAAAQSGPMTGYVDTMLRTDTLSATGADDRGELVRLFTSTFRNGGDLNAVDRPYVAKVVAAKTGLSQADAEKRVADVSNAVRADVDAARKAAAQLAFWLAGSMLLGAFCASLAATEGGGLRDGTWGKRH